MWIKLYLYVNKIYLFICIKIAAWIDQDLNKISKMCI